MKNYLLPFLFLSLLACRRQKNTNDIESPLATVIKLESAEAFRDYETALKFMDVEQTYGKVVTRDSANMTPEQAWRKWVDFNFNLARSKKFTNHTRFHEYKITEIPAGDRAEVRFKSLDGGMSVVYQLELRGSKWVVVEKEFVR